MPSRTFYGLCTAGNDHRYMRKCNSLSESRHILDLLKDHEKYGRIERFKD